MTPLRIVLLIVILGEAAWMWFDHNRLASVGLPIVNLDVLEKIEAEELIPVLSQVDASDPQQLIDLAEVYRTLGFFPAADYCFMQAARCSPGSSEYLHFWGVTLSRMGRLKEAREKFSAAIAAGAPHGPYSWTAIGECWLREVKPRKAEAALRQAQQVPWAQLLLCRLLIRLGRASEAVSISDRLLSDYPKATRTQQMRSQIEEALGNHEEALRYEELARHSMQMIPRGTPASRNDELRMARFGSRGQYEEANRLLEAGDFENASLVAQRVAESSSWSEPASMLWVSCELKAGRHQIALGILKDLMDRIGVSANVSELKGDVQLELGDESAARKTWKLGTEFEVSQSLHEKLASLCRRMEDIDSVRHHEGMAEYAAGKAAWFKDDLGAARDAFSKATEKVPDYAHAWYYLGETRRALGDVTESAAAHRRCVEINPNHGRALKVLERLEDASRN